MRFFNFLKALFLILFIRVQGFSQDLIGLSNGDKINGEIKTLTKSILTVETPYSDQDFLIEWDEVIQLVSPREFLIFLNTKEKMYVSFGTSGKDAYTILTSSGEYLREVKLNDIVIINEIEEDFKSRFNASLSAGFTITKANNSRQLSTRGNASYYTRSWELSANFNTVNSIQDSVERVSRTDGSLNFSYLLYKNWFASVRYELLSNTEQNLDLRNNYTLSVGNLIIRNNSLYLSGSGGISYNVETYGNETEPNRSSEGFIGVEFNAYDIGDLSFLTKLGFFPSLTTSDRKRLNFNADLKYEFPLDFFIKIGYTSNFDSNPPNGGPKNDFVFQTTVGWEF